ncbi:MAG: class I SAM-dependent methyltransferase [Clostridiales bacterium]|nr:class I SAM-dependent methyltransferase [Clostridiales bacterium]
MGYCNTVQEFMSCIATKYDMICHPNTSQRIDYLSNKIRNSVNKEEISVLDLTCSTGETTIALNRSGFKTTGIDYSKGMIEVARSKTTQSDMFIKMNIIENCLETKKFEVVYFNSSIWINNMKDLRTVLGNASKVIKEDGILILDLPNSSNFISNYSQYHSKMSNYDNGIIFRNVKFSDPSSIRDKTIDVNQTFCIVDRKNQKSYAYSCDFQFRFHDKNELNAIMTEIGFFNVSCSYDYNVKNQAGGQNIQLVYSRRKCDS